MALTETSSRTCDLHTNLQMSADFCIYFIKHKKLLNSENSHPINKKKKYEVADNGQSSVNKL